MTEAATVRRGEVPPWTLGWRLQRALAWADMTTEEMAEELGVARSTINRWCNDKGHVSRGYLKLWAMRTAVPLDWLESGEEVSPSDRERRSLRLDKSDILAFRKSLGRRFVVDAEVAR